MTTTMVKPWITPYADERHAGAFAYDGTRIFFPESTGIVEDRTLGVLWQPCPDSPTGPIFWREMHTARQRQAMLDRLCQVCGEAITSKDTPWLLPAIEAKVRRVNGRSFSTNTPPTCSACIELAREQCPNLSSRGSTELLVHHYRTWGVFGDFVDTNGRPRQGDLQFGTPLIPRMMARHLVVEILDYRKVKR